MAALDQNSCEVNTSQKLLVLYFPNILHLSSRDCLEAHGNILKSHRFYRFLLNRNVHQSIFLFFKDDFPPTLLL